MLRKFKNHKNTKETINKTSSVYGQGVIIAYQVRNWFLKFRFCDRLLKHKPRPRLSSDLHQGVLRKLMECKSTQKLALDFNASQSTICFHL